MKVEFNEFIAIGDLAGRYEEFLELINEFPTDLPIVLLGDINDRGKDTNKLIQYCIDNSDRIYAVQSNHGHMMVDWYERKYCYEFSLYYLHNGGPDTLRSYGYSYNYENKAFLLSNDNSTSGRPINSEEMKLIELEYDIARKLIPKQHIEYLKNLPMYIEGESWIATHCPINPTLPLEEKLIGDHMFDRDVHFIWNRGKARRRDKFQLHGHNANTSHLELKDKDGIYGLNMDSSRGNILSAVYMKDGKIIEIKSVEYKDSINENNC